MLYWMVGFFFRNQVFKWFRGGGGGEKYMTVYLELQPLIVIMFKVYKIINLIPER